MNGSRGAPVGAPFAQIRPAQWKVRRILDSEEQKLFPKASHRSNKIKRPADPVTEAEPFEPKEKHKNCFAACRQASREFEIGQSIMAPSDCSRQSSRD